MLGGDKNAFSVAIDQLAPLTRKFGGLIQEVLQIEARKGYAYAEKALPRFGLAPMPAARPEDRRDMMDRLDRMYEQPYITPGIQNRIEGASLFNADFDISKLEIELGETANTLRQVKELLEIKKQVNKVMGAAALSAGAAVFMKTVAPTMEDFLSAPTGASRVQPRTPLGPATSQRPSGIQEGTPRGWVETMQDFNNRLDKLFEQPRFTPGLQDDLEGASLPDAGFDVSRLGKTFGEVASASFIGGLLAQNAGAPRPTPESQIFRDDQGRPLNGRQPAAFPLPVIPSAAQTTQLRNDQAQAEQDKARGEAADELQEAFKRVNAESTEFTKGLNDQLKLLGSQRKYLDMGFSDSLSRDLANLDAQLSDSLNKLTAKRDKALELGNDPATVTGFYNEQKASLEAIFALNVKLTQELEKQGQIMRTRQDDRIGLGMQEGVQSYLESIGTMRQATEELTVNGIKGVENAIFELVTTGKTNFREFAADILRQTASMIIQQLVLRNVLLIVKSAFGFSSGGAFGGGAALGFGGAADPLGAGGAFWNAKGNAFTGKGVAAYAMGGTFAKNNIIPYAKGGTFTNSVVSKPTLFKFAAGGTMQTGVMGEAGPEAIMPLSRGPNGKLGVASSGSGTTNVTVNVDASGSKAQGDSGKSEQLGRAVSQAVQDELLKQKRPGGLLA
jgi:lambda family phage tail tape measure protein